MGSMPTRLRPNKTKFDKLTEECDKSGSRTHSAKLCPLHQAMAYSSLNRASSKAFTNERALAHSIGASHRATTPVAASLCRVAIKIS